MTKRYEYITAMFLGCYLGDSAGMVVETWDAEKIAKTYGRVHSLLAPNGHKWFNGQPAGMATDDWQLTKWVARSLLDHDLCMDSMAEVHVKAYKESTAGWGRTTKEAIRRIANGKSWTESGLTTGYGNGVAMKVAPVGAYMAMMRAYLTRNGKQMTDEEICAILRLTRRLALMTHRTRAGISSAMAQMAAVNYCLSRTPLTFRPEIFIKHVLTCAAAAPAGQELPLDKDDFFVALKKIENYRDWTPEQIIKECNGGTCYVHNSLPFTYLFFLKRPTSLETMWDIINSGGDTDSNASMCGALLGALNGLSIFPKSLIRQIPSQYLCEIAELSDAFATKFGF